MEPWDQDWLFSESVVDDLQDYLLSDQLYWPFTGAPGRPIGGRMPRLTLGNLLLSLQRLKAVPQDEKSDRAAVVRQKVEQMRKRWRVHWEQKALQEYRERLGRWQHFVNELRSQNPPSASEYAYNVRLRVILELLKSELGGENFQVEDTAVGNLDNALRSALVDSEFIWDQAFKPAFPADRYWYLYGKPGNRRSGQDG